MTELGKDVLIVLLSFLQETIPRRFIPKDQWPPNSPDTNPLDFYFWNEVKTKVYNNRMNNPFEDKEEIIARIKSGSLEQLCVKS